MAGLEEAAEFFCQIVVMGADENGLADGFGEAQSLFRIGAEVAFVQHRDWHHAGLLGEYEIAVEAARIPIVIQAADEEGHIDIGGERLGLAVIGDSCEEGLTLNDGDDEGGIGLGDGDPVAGDGEVERRACGVLQAAGEFAAGAPIFRFEFEDAAAGAGNSRRG